MVIINAEMNSKIHIGRAGEHKATTVVFDISEWVEQFGERYAELVIEQNSLIYPQKTEYQKGDTKVEWVVTRSNTAEPGIGKCELFYFGEEELVQLYKKPDDWNTNWKSYYLQDGSMVNTESAPVWDWKDYSDDIPYYEGVRPIIKSALYEIIVTNALGYGEDEPPGAYESWVDDVLDAATDAKEARDQAREAQRKAEEAQAKAEEAQAKAEEAQQKAEDAQKAAEEAQVKAETAQEKAEEAQAKAEAAQTAAEQAKADAETAQRAAETAQAAAEQAKADAEAASNAASEAEARAKAQADLSKQSADASADSALAASNAQTAAEAARTGAEAAQTEATTQATNAANSAAAALKSEQAALKYVSNPPQPRATTGTWWIYDPVNDVYVNSHEPYGIKIHYIFETVEEMNAFTPEDLGVNAAINIPATVTESEYSQIYVYTENGWEYLLSMAGIGGGGDGNMKDEVYDPDGSVVDAGGIPNYVKENATQVTWSKWTAADFGS